MICVVGSKGAPGASTLALLLAALWPGGAALVEADPAGGDAALRLTGPSGQTLPSEPNLTRLAVDTANDLTQPNLDWVLKAALQTAPGVPVVCGLTAAAAMAQTVSRYAPALAARLGALNEVVVDAGRLTPASAALPLAAAASVVLLVTKDGADYFYGARDLLGDLLAELGREPVVVAAVVARPRRGRAATRELAAVLASRGVPAGVAGWVAHDPRGLRRFLNGQPGARRTVLFRTARPLAVALATAAEQHCLAGQMPAQDATAWVSITPRPLLSAVFPNGQEHPR